MVAFGNLKPYIMKNLALLFTAMILGSSSAMAVTIDDKVATSNAYGYNNSFIFVEDGITFSVYPDGEFDFYIDQRVGVNANVNLGHTQITYNSGYDYNPYVQYDDYGAVIQVENIPIYYDYYGRVSQVGNVEIFYHNGRVSRVGGLYVYYNNRGIYSHHVGYINVYNRTYVYRPFHRYFARPAVGFCLVYNRPYRRYYAPVRYTYVRPYHNNYRKAHAHIGREYRYNRPHSSRSTIYRNDSRAVVRSSANRSNNGYRSSGNASYRNEPARTTSSRNSNTARSTTVSQRNAGNNKNATVQRSSNGRTEVGRTQNTSTTKRSSNVNQRRQIENNVARSAAPAARTQKSVAARSSDRRSNGNVQKSTRTSTSRSTVATKSTRSSNGNTTARSRRQ
jgi:hypothetical protein